MISCLVYSRSGKSDSGFPGASASRAESTAASSVLKISSTNARLSRLRRRNDSAAVLRTPASGSFKYLTSVLLIDSSFKLPSADMAARRIVADESSIELIMSFVSKEEFKYGAISLTVSKAEMRMRESSDLSRGIKYEIAALT